MNELFNSVIDKWWLIGFIEAEGYFYNNGKQSFFQLTQHLSDVNLLISISNFIGDGKIRENVRRDGRCLAIFSISKKKTLKEIIIPLCWNNFHSKKKTFQFKSWVEKAFPEIDTNQLNVNDQRIDNNWLVGFVDGDGSFYSIVSRNEEYKIQISSKDCFWYNSSWYWTEIIGENREWILRRNL